MLWREPNLFQAGVPSWSAPRARAQAIEVNGKWRNGSGLDDKVLWLAPLHDLEDLITGVSVALMISAFSSICFL